MRSKLFVPGSRPELFDKALASAADAISFDLEDAVVEESKAQARAMVGDYLERTAGARSKTMIVRVNGMQSNQLDADLEAVVRRGLDLINLPKVESPDEIVALADRLAKIENRRDLTHPVGILANIESARGLRCAAAIATAHSRVAGLQIGYADLFVPSGIDRRYEPAIDYVRIQVRLAATEAGIDAYDGAFTDLHDMDGFRAEAEASRRLGYAGKSCVHPRQIDVANGVFRPSDAEIAHARAVVEATRTAISAGRGAFVVDGRMVDGPLITRAETIVALARRLGLIAGSGA
jgi:citrate lyase subunit beta/citryl-CoA lyase